MLSIIIPVRDESESLKGIMEHYSRNLTNSEIRSAGLPLSSSIQTRYRPVGVRVPPIFPIFIQLMIVALHIPDPRKNSSMY